MKFKIILIIIVLSIIFTSCGGNGSKERNTVKISLYKNNYSDYKIMDSVIKEITRYAREKNIEIVIKTYFLNELSYDDIILKQNIDIFTGETDICFGNVNDLYALKKLNGDYTKIKTYKNIMDNYKGEYCIPLAFDGYARFLNKEIFDEYNINKGNVITNLKYYECKQKMKDAGDRFKLNEVEYMELVEYYALKYEFVMEKDNKDLKSIPCLFISNKCGI
ncbi:hypothetical protein [Sedimentibacter sp.]|uniref:hypothetical protein n=1 Tax=Sedimentibacter sp. TaxID=1960295 RepID=UPI0028B184F9|nr:hypothetical protein [Sedimentibacter sp.]